MLKSYPLFSAEKKSPNGYFAICKTFNLFCFSFAFNNFTFLWCWLFAHLRFKTLCLRLFKIDLLFSSFLWEIQIAEWIDATGSGVVDSVLIPSRVKQWLWNWYLQFICLTLSIKGQCGEQAGKFACCAVGKALSGIPHLGVVDRWPVTPKRSDCFLVIGGLMCKLQINLKVFSCSFSMQRFHLPEINVLCSDWTVFVHSLIEISC